MKLEEDAPVNAIGPAIATVDPRLGLVKRVLRRFKKVREKQAE